MSLVILVVDDERLIVETLSELLSWEGHEVLRAANGVAALEQIAARKPDLLIIDFMMPLMHGVATIERLRADPATRDLPIVLMTAAPTSLEGPALYDALLVKPFNVGDLKASIQQALDAHTR